MGDPVKRHENRYCIYADGWLITDRRAFAERLSEIWSEPPNQPGFDSPTPDEVEAGLKRMLADPSEKGDGDG